MVGLEVLQEMMLRPIYIVLLVVSRLVSYPVTKLLYTEQSWKMGKPSVRSAKGAEAMEMAIKGVASDAEFLHEPMPWKTCKKVLMKETLSRVEGFSFISLCHAKYASQKFDQ